MCLDDFFFNFFLFPYQYSSRCGLSALHCRCRLSRETRYDPRRQSQDGNTLFSRFPFFFKEKKRGTLSKVVFFLCASKTRRRRKRGERGGGGEEEEDEHERIGVLLSVNERTSPWRILGKDKKSRRPSQWLGNETSNKEKLWRLRRWEQVTNVLCPRLHKFLHLVSSLVLFVHEKRRKRKRRGRCGGGISSHRIATQHSACPPGGLFDAKRTCVLC